MTYGERLRELRAEMRLSLREVEERGGPNKDTMSLLERDIHRPHPQTLGRIAHAFDMSVSELRAELEAAEHPLAEAPPSPQLTLNGALEEERRNAVVQLFDGLRRYLLDAADHWTHEAETGGLLWSEDAALVYSIEVNIEAARLYGLVAEHLEPALEELLPGTLTLRNEQRKLVEAIESLTNAVEAANAAADAVAPPREPTDEEWAAAIPIIESMWEEMDEVEQRRLLREFTKALAEESEQAAEERRGRIA